MCGLVHEAFDRPVGPAGPNRAQPAGAKGAVGEIVRQRAYALRAHIVPMIGAGDRERIVRFSVSPLDKVPAAMTKEGQPAEA